MKQKIKKYIYLVNDVSNLLLKKERIKDEENAKKLRIALIVVCVILAFSLTLNILYILKY